MIRKLLNKEEAGAATVLALSGALVVLACKGDGPLSLGSILSGVLSNPVPRVGAENSGVSARAPRRRAAA